MGSRKVRTAALAAAGLALVTTPPALAGGLAGVATEWTQLANYEQLARLTSLEASQLSVEGRQLSTQLEQLETDILAYRNMVQNTERLPAGFHRRALEPVLELRRLYMQAGSLAGSGQELDAFLRSGLVEDSRFDAGGYSRTDHAERYDAWQDRWSATLTAGLRQADMTIEDVETEARLLDRLTARADQANGNLQALQVANEMAGSLSRQMLDLRALQASQAEQTAIAWARVLGEADVREAMQRRYEAQLEIDVQQMTDDRRGMHELLGIGR